MTLVTVPRLLVGSCQFGIPNQDNDEEPMHNAKVQMFLTNDPVNYNSSQSLLLDKNKIYLTYFYMDDTFIVVTFCVLY